jgi:hypothetical protein|tara:strand:- start:1322 stop:1516 length:195 start_codon:yes stop_codon:yes gene_type:complete
MSVGETNYNVLFRAPALPIPKEEYNQGDAMQQNNVLRLYFNQLDEALRSNAVAERSQAISWFFS